MKKYLLKNLYVVKLVKLNLVERKYGYYGQADIVRTHVEYNKSSQKVFVAEKVKENESGAKFKLLTRGGVVYADYDCDQGLKEGGYFVREKEQLILSCPATSKNKKISFKSIEILEKGLTQGRESLTEEEIEHIGKEFSK